MFSAKLEARLWKDIVNTVNNIVEEAPFEIKEEGIYMRAMDPSHISMIDLVVPKEIFDEFSFDKEVSVGIDVNEMNKIMRRAKPSDILIFEVDESKIHLTFIGESKRTFGIPIIDVLEKRSKQPEIQFTVTIKADAGLFQEDIKDASVVADHVIFEAQKEKLLITAEGDMSDIKIVNKKSSMEEYNVEEEARATFNLSYLSDIAKSLYGSIVLRFGMDLPLMLEFEIDKAKVKFILAPRIERE
ncbi:MAG: proliferating cell nuclear antigen (pcna) [Euryarchaeota archaeon]|nr:proliferating cell nuclear antigen (pcna) [Euryarchaeota archaeon]